MWLDKWFGQYLHVLPVGDLIEHSMYSACPCGPSRKWVSCGDGTGRIMVVHHSLDGRELHEAA